MLVSGIGLGVTSCFVLLGLCVRFRCCLGAAPALLGGAGFWGWSSVAGFGAGRRRRTAAKLGMKFGSDLHDGGGALLR